MKQQNKGVSGAGNEADIRPENAEKKAGANSWSRTGEGGPQAKRGLESSDRMQPSRRG